MKTITINKNSWHFKLSGLDHYDLAMKDWDICEYRKLVFARVVGFILKAIIMIITFSFCFIGAKSMIHAALAIWFNLVYGVEIMDDWAESGIIILTAIGATVAIVGLLYTAANWSTYTKENRAVYAMYSSWKDKWCAKVEFK